ncbi:MAG: TIGR00725 family protein [Oscillatoriaceae bacterium SKW80]|nr:TIGR00725 family protein [Oscillatoriaceae bacterium SKYG93]MCX8121668.1 TIGR00725 family protein [Oscillatoriaceae bacterium SKW80]MDW8453977.1 TIGR00725 family protein [Oscillatoriaceae cyanobacterium SKYGB_i_bin93]HIK28780.1 TIGR00725 family protein [Oscillatoriaceae cyanobacterium M7585_C2015_266]
MRKIVIGVMGPGANPLPEDCKNAWELGKLIAQKGWVLLTGGRDEGVMDAASKGAKSAGGLVVGILPTADTRGMSEAVDIAIATAMGSARNNINVLSSDVVIACGISAGTTSEIALALVAKKKVILLNNHPESQVFFKKLSEENVFVAQTPLEAIAITSKLISTGK